MGNSALLPGRIKSETSSTCSTDIDTAAHNFEVRDCPLLQGLGGGKHISSSKFRVGGYDWKIVFYPDGTEKDESSDHAACFLCCISPANYVRARFSFNVLEKLDGDVQVTNYGCRESTFSSAGEACGQQSFVSKSKLRPLLDINNGCFTIRCLLTVIHEPRTVRKRKPIVVTQPSLRESLEHMLKDGEGADVTFSVQEQRFNAHRCVLAARSQVFKAELFGPMKESATQSVIKVDDVEPQTFEALLHFIYTDAMLDDNDDDDDDEGKTDRLQHLLVAADRYGVDALRVMCEDKLYEGIDVETVATTLLLAEQQNCKDLKEACIQFMGSRNILGAVMATNGFKQLVARCPLLMEDILKEMAGTPRE
ncbi:unnamed protein product [Alopecurus aequalis]